MSVSRKSKNSQLTKVVVTTLNYYRYIIYRAPSDLPIHESGDEGKVRHFLRVERQTLRRLPTSDAVAFGIRVTFTPIENLKSNAARALLAILRGQDEEMIDYKDGSKHHDEACAALAAISAQ